MSYVWCPHHPSPTSSSIPKEKKKTLMFFNSTSLEQQLSLFSTKNRRGQENVMLHAVALVKLQWRITQNAEHQPRIYWLCDTVVLARRV